MSSSSSFSFSNSSSHQLSFDQIRKATDNFDTKNMLQSDGGWALYVAKIYYSESKFQKVYVSMKRFNAEFDDKLMNEAHIAISLQHSNILSLLGYCSESDVKVLVYEYTEKGSLYDYVKKSSTFSLSWKQRLEICLGAASGLQYLHKETDKFPKGIVHRGVNLSSVLLDENWVAKVSNFELSSAFGDANTDVAKVKRRDDHLAPEYTSIEKTSRKMDVFAFGVVLLEVLCCKMPWDRLDKSYYASEDEDLGVWAQENVDIEIAEGISDDSLKTYTNVIGRCLQRDPKKRPTMDQVVLLLETAIKCQKSGGEPVRNVDPVSPRKAKVNKSASTSSSSELCILPLLSSCPKYSVAYIKGAIYNSKVLGKGGEGIVYKAEIHLNGEIIKTPVAVKKLFLNSPEFEKEILNITKIRHHNIVSLLGYGQESEKFLIYEYMEKGSLAAYVKMDSAFCLSWEQRLNICLGAARGLQHLHKKTSECKTGMIHCDMKPANILLNSKWDAKVSDFGLLKLSSSSQTNSVINVSKLKGTPGYYAPEYVYDRLISTKIDVYSFGMVMFEVLCRRKKWDLLDESNYGHMDVNENVTLLAQENVDKQIKDSISYESLKLFTKTIGDSLRKDPKKRPTMAVVVRSLETALMFQNDYVKDIRISESPFSIGNELKKDQLDHELRAENIESMFKDINNPLPDLHTAIFSWDASTLKIDDLKDVIRSCPAEDQIEILKNFNGDKEMLGKREKFFLELAKVPRLESKLGVFYFSMTLSHQVNDLRQSMETVNVATIEVKGSKKLRQVIQTIGSLRNSQNQGTVPGFDKKFRLCSLLELSNTRSKSSNMTMMQFLCKHLTKKKPELLDFYKDLVHLEAAAELQVQYLAEKIQALGEGLQKVEQEVTASDNDGFISASFQKAMRSFLDTAEAEVNSLSSFYSEVRSNLDTLVRYFGEDPARYPFELVATSLLKFIRMFITENQLMTDLGNKKLEQNP